VAALPANVKDGINYIDDKTVILSLLAPRKDFVFVTGDFNAWKVDPAFQMKKTPDGERFWLQLDNLVPKKEYVFQYLVNGNLRIADPYTDKVADPWNDAQIGEATYPGLIPFTKTEYGIASVLQTAQQPYNGR
jgi:1,4-alpha-glucan branching enzyme